MGSAGRAIVFSGVVVTVGLAAMAILPVPFLRTVGLVCALIPCPGCGDNPYVDYSEIPPLLQWLRGPRKLQAALEAYDKHLGPLPGPNGDSAGSLGSPRAFRAWPLA
jgi:hypothetical protein